MATYHVDIAFVDETGAELSDAETVTARNEAEAERKALRLYKKGTARVVDIEQLPEREPLPAGALVCAPDTEPVAEEPAQNVEPVPAIRCSFCTNTEELRVVRYAGEVFAVCPQCLEEPPF